VRIKRVHLPGLKRGQSTLVGPYKKANTVSSMISRLGAAGAKYKQKRVVVVDPGPPSAQAFYLVTRTK
jgi:hypothetical protein